LGVGLLGVVFIGNNQDRNIYAELQAQQPAVLAQVEGPTQRSVWGTYKAIDEEKVKKLSDADKSIVDDISVQATKTALKNVAILPCIMLVCYLILIGYFRTKGGYDRQVLTGHAANDAEYTGGIPAPAEL